MLKQEHKAAAKSNRAAIKEAVAAERERYKERLAQAQSTHEAAIRQLKGDKQAAVSRAVENANADASRQSNKWQVTVERLKEQMTLLDQRREHHMKKKPQVGRAQLDNSGETACAAWCVVRGYDCGVCAAGAEPA